MNKVMSSVVMFLLLRGHLLVLLASLSSSLPLCTDLRAPQTHQQQPLGFCSSYGGGGSGGGGVCCDSAKDAQLEKQFKAMDISDNTACADLVKSILCSQCDPFSAELFPIGKDVPPVVPILCNSSATPNSSSSKQAKSSSFCSTLWSTCQNVPISNSPFAPSLQSQAKLPATSPASTLAKLWQSETAFCGAFAGDSLNKTSSLCFEGKPVSLNNTTTPLNPVKGVCLEKIDNGSYISMAARPDGSNAAFFSNQPGKVYLAMVPEQDSGEALDLDESSPFVDLTDVVHLDASFGMMGMAFHPDFSRNGRFFASFNCDNTESSACIGTCGCNTDVNCDPSKLNSSGSAQPQPCRFHSVIAEYSANGTSSSGPADAKTAKASEVRRIFTMGLPYTSNHGGQILFGPEDGYLYFMMGDGGSKFDPYNFAQNKKSLLGKIMRLDIDNIPSAEEISKQGFWGNYSVPQDNPYFSDKDSRPEIWALGLRNPWRCSFDAERPLYFACGDTGENQYEEVDIITKGGNYGWSVFEGHIPLKLQQSSGDNTSAIPRDLIFPALGYSHSDINKKEGSAAISGGPFYRSRTDPCLYGSYLYADLYASALWAGAENPADSGNFTSSRIPFSCAHDSPIKCDSVPGSTLPALGYIFSFAQDNKKDVFILTNTGVYRVVRPSRCNYTCSKETVIPAATSPSTSPSPSASNKSQFTTGPYKALVVLSLLLLLLQV